MDHDEDDVLDIDGALVDEEEDKIKKEFQVTDEDGLPIPEEDDLDEEEDEDVI